MHYKIGDEVLTPFGTGTITGLVGNYVHLQTSEGVQQLYGAWEVARLGRPHVFSFQQRALGGPSRDNAEAAAIAAQRGGMNAPVAVLPNTDPFDDGTISDELRLATHHCYRLAAELARRAARRTRPKVEKSDVFRRQAA